MKMPTPFATLTNHRIAASLALAPLAAVWLICTPVAAQVPGVGAGQVAVGEGDNELPLDLKEAQKKAAEKARAHQQKEREAERLEIVAKREVIEQQRIADEKRCYQQFAVEGCLTEARVAAREKDAPLRERELQINDMERRDKADERLKAIEEKKEKNAAVPMKSQQREHTKNPLATPVPKGSGAKPPVDEQAMQAQRQTEAQQRAAKQADYVRRHEQNRTKAEQGRAEREAKAKADHDARLKAAADHKASSLKQAQESNKKAAPLPAPAN